MLISSLSIMVLLLLFSRFSLPSFMHSKQLKTFVNRYIYIDLGTNDGSSVDAFLPSQGFNETIKVENDGSKLAQGDKIFFTHNNYSIPIYDKRNYEIYAVEANPFFTSKLEAQKKHYMVHKLSKSYTLFNGTGISTKNGVGYLILDCPGFQLTQCHTLTFTKL